MLIFISFSSQLVFRRAHGKLSGLNFSQDHFRGLVFIRPAAVRPVVKITGFSAGEVDDHVFFRKSRTIIGIVVIIAIRHRQSYAKTDEFIAVIRAVAGSGRRSAFARNVGL